MLKNWMSKSIHTQSYLIFGAVLEGSRPQEGFQKVGKTYSNMLAKDGLERRSGRWFSGKLDLWGPALAMFGPEIGSGSMILGFLVSRGVR